MNEHLCALEIAVVGDEHAGRGAGAKTRVLRVQTFEELGGLRQGMVSRNHEFALDLAPWSLARRTYRAPTESGISPTE